MLQLSMGVAPPLLILLDNHPPPNPVRARSLGISQQNAQEHGDEHVFRKQSFEQLMDLFGFEFFI